MKLNKNNLYNTIKNLLNNSLKGAIDIIVDDFHEVLYDKSHDEIGEITMVYYVDNYMAHIKYFRQGWDIDKLQCVLSMLELEGIISCSQHSWLPEVGCGVSLEEALDNERWVDTVYTEHIHGYCHDIGMTDTMVNYLIPKA